MKHIVFVESNASGLLGLKAAKDRGYRVSFIRSELNSHFYESDEAKEVLATLDEVVTVHDSFDETELYNVITKIHCTAQIDALITVLEYSIQAVANVAKRIGLRFTDPSAISNVRDKSVCRSILREAGLENTKFKVATCEIEAIEAAREIGFPCILKPSKGAASIGAASVGSTEELEVAIENFRSSFHSMDPRLKAVVESPMLIEERIEGRMMSVELGKMGSKNFVFTIDERRRAPENEVIEVGTTMPAQLSPSDWESVEEFSIAAANALGFDIGIFHIEIMLTKFGPKLIEFNPRLMGGSLPRVYNFIYQDNIYEYLMDIHLGNKIAKIPEKPVAVASSRIFGSAVKKKSAEKFDLGWMKNYEKFGLQLNLGIKPGDVAPKLASNHDYIGALRIRGENGMMSSKLASEVLKRLSESLDLPLVG